MKKLSLFFFLISVLFMGVNNAYSQIERDTISEIPLINKGFLVVVHIINKNEKDTLPNKELELKVSELFEGANIWFEPIAATFKTCDFRYIKNTRFKEFTSSDDSLVTHMINQYYAPARINVYVTESIASSSCAFATSNGINNISKKVGPYIVLSETCLTVNTLVHELGHFFGLLHTFGDEKKGVSKELVNGSNCKTEGDKICDTPADPYGNGDSQVDADCVFQGTVKDGNGQYYDPDVSNIMSYYPCGNRFTQDQYILMAETFKDSKYPW